jgi:hypothetical protein
MGAMTSRIYLVFFILISFLLLPYLPIVFSQVGSAIGVNNYHIQLAANLGDILTAGIGVFNPSDYEENVTVYAECDNCVSDAKIFGFTVGSIRQDIYQFVSLSKREMTLPPRTTADSAPIVWVVVNPKLLNIQYFGVTTPDSINFFIRLINPKYGNGFEIPYPAFFIGEKEFRGRVSFDVVSSSFGPLGVAPSIATTLLVKVKGMPLGSFILILAALIIAILLIVKRKYGLRRICSSIFRRKKVGKSGEG